MLSRPARRRGQRPPSRRKGGDQLHERRLGRARSAKDADGFAGADLKVDALQRHPTGLFE